MSIRVFPDNTVLINFAHLHRMDLLQRLVRNPCWCATVAQECATSAGFPGLEDMLEAARIFGEPLFPTAAEHVLIQTYRMQLSRPGDPPHKNLGEAETLAIIHTRGMHAVFFTDDAGPAGLLEGATDGPRVQIAGTWELLRVAFRHGYVDANTLWSYVAILRDNKRHLPPGQAARDRGSFDVWLGARS